LKRWWKSLVTSIFMVLGGAGWIGKTLSGLEQGEEALKKWGLWNAVVDWVVLGLRVCLEYWPYALMCVVIVLIYRMLVFDLPQEKRQDEFRNERQKTKKMSRRDRNQ
jgi:hypothetical protein